MKNQDHREMLVVNMFSGKYPIEHVAHEIINIFRTDDGKSYIYVPDDGHMSRHDVGKVLMVCYLGSNIYEVIGRVFVDELLGDYDEGQKELLKSMRYYGVSLDKVMDAINRPYDEAGERVTFLAEKCQRPAKPIFIACNPESKPCHLQDKGHVVNIRVLSSTGKPTRLVQRQRRYLGRENNDSRTNEYEFNQFELYDKLDCLFDADDSGWENFPFLRKSKGDKSKSQEETNSVSLKALLKKHVDAYSNGRNEETLITSCKRFFEAIELMAKS